MKMLFICTKVCEKSDFEELRNCKNLKRVGGLRTCKNKDYILSLALREYEKKSSTYFKTIHLGTPFKSLKVMYTCDKCKSDWPNCNNRKGDICLSNAEHVKGLKKLIGTIDSKLFQNEKRFEWACDVARDIRKEVEKERGPFFGSILLKWSEIKNISDLCVRELITMKTYKLADEYKKKK